MVLYDIIALSCVENRNRSDLMRPYEGIGKKMSKQKAILSGEPERINKKFDRLARQDRRPSRQALSIILINDF
jgi:hypothetical protein